MKKLLSVVFVVFVMATFVIAANTLTSFQELKIPTDCKSDPKSINGCIDKTMEKDAQILTTTLITTNLVKDFESDPKKLPVLTTPTSIKTINGVSIITTTINKRNVTILTGSTI